MTSSSHSSYDERYDEDDDHHPHTGKMVQEHEPEPEEEQAEEDETGGAETESEQASLKTWMNEMNERNGGDGMKVMGIIQRGYKKIRRGEPGKGRDVTHDSLQDVWKIFYAFLP